MRVTNSMIFGNSLNNIFRNVRHVNSLVQQIETKKLIGRPSDNPILAARSLRYRTILEETEQFLSNANGGLSWMNATESAFMNLLYGSDSALQEMNRILVAATDGGHNLLDRQGQVKALREFFDQIALEMNQTYMGRYVFSGFYTQEPPILTTDQSGRSFVITQQFAQQDIHRIQSFQRFGMGEQPTINQVNALKLPYRGANFSFSPLDNNGIPIDLHHPTGIRRADGTFFNVEVRNSHDADAYTPPDDGNTIFHLADTGELIFGDNVAAQMRNGISVTYEVRDLKAGELNPIVYFDTVEMAGLRTEMVTVGEGGNAYRSNMVLESREMHNLLMRLTTDINCVQLFQFQRSDGRNLPWTNPFNLGAEMEAFFQLHYASDADLIAAGVTTFDEFVQQMYTDPADNDFTIAPADVTRFLNVLRGAFDTGFLSINLPPPIDTVTTTVTIYDGSVIPADAGRIDIVFNVTTLDGSTIVFNNVTCSPASVLSYGHQFLHRGFSMRQLPPIITRTNYAVDGTEHYSTQDHDIRIEMAAANHVTINSHARDAYTANFFSDLRNLFEFVENMQPTDRRALEAHFRDLGYTGTALDNAVDTFLSTEQSYIQGVLHDRFSNLLRVFPRHTDEMQREHASLGSRMNRIEMLTIRLEEEETNYTALLSANEDTPLQEAIMRKAAAEAAFQAALRANAMTIQLSLVNFLR